MGKPYRIIALDGGGIGGLYSVTLLDRLLAVFPDLIQQTDLIAGTSTGGIIALSLAAGRTTAEIRQIYRDRTKDVFNRSIWRTLTSWFALWQSKYPADGLVRVCRDALGGAKMGDLLKTVMVPAFDLMSEASPANPSWRARFFNNFTTTPGNPDLNELASDIAIRSASAPTYFPSYQGFVDGSVIANSPAMVAVAEAVQRASVGVSDVRVLSIGTGGQIKYINGTDLQWGGLKWILPLIYIFMDGMSLVTDSACQKLLNDRYHRLSPVVPRISMDDVTKLAELEHLALSADLGPTIHWVGKTFLGDCPISQ